MELFIAEIIFLMIFGLHLQILNNYDIILKQNGLV
jgi:hypothetical protein